MMRPDIGVFGSGAWGTALAITWARKGAKVALWGNFPDEMAQMAATRRHLCSAHQAWSAVLGFQGSAEMTAAPRPNS